MSIHTKTKIILSIGVLLIIIGASVWAGPKKQSSSDPIKLGVIASMTGPGAYYGESIRNGTTLAVEEINAAGGINGRPIELLFEDDGTNPKNTTTAAEKLTSIDRAIALIGVQWDFLANAAVPVGERAGVAVISTAAPFDSILGSSHKSPNFFTTYPSVEANEPSIETFFAREDVHTAAIIAVQNDWGSAHVNAYTEAANKSGVAVVQVFRVIQTDHNDFKTQIAEIKGLHPDAVLLALNDGDNTSYVKWHHDFGLDAAVLGNMNFVHPFQNGQLTYAQGAGMYYMDFTDSSSDFAKKYEARFGAVPHIAADTSYDAIYVIKEAIEKEGSTKEGILRGLKEVSSYRGASGTIDFSEGNFPENKESILDIITVTGVAQIK